MSLVKVAAVVGTWSNLLAEAKSNLTLKSVFEHHFKRRTILNHVQ